LDYSQRICSTLVGLTRAVLLSDILKNEDIRRKKGGIEDE